MPSEEPGRDLQRVHKIALNLHAHFVHYVHKLTTTTCALQKIILISENFLSQGLGTLAPCDISKHNQLNCEPIDLSRFNFESLWQI